MAFSCFPRPSSAPRGGFGRKEPTRARAPFRSTRRAAAVPHAAFQRRVIFSLVQLSNAPSAILVRLGIFTLTSEVQSSNTPHSILVTDLGITTFTSEVQPQNAPHSIF